MHKKIVKIDKFKILRNGFYGEIAQRCFCKKTEIFLLKVRICIDKQPPK